MVTNALRINKSCLIKDLLELCKIRVVSLIVLTAVVGMFLAPQATIQISTVIFATIGIFLNAASAAAFNHVAEYRIDALMDRTSQRPLARGRTNQEYRFDFCFLLVFFGFFFISI